MRKRLFLTWLLMASLMLVATVIGIRLHAIRWIHEQDPTFISFTTIVLCWVATFYVGPTAWHVGHVIHDDKSKQLPSMYARIKNIKFAMNLCPFLGLLGTVVGLIMALENFKRNGSTVNQESLHAILVNLGTAMVTTAVGMICALFLWVQYHPIETQLETYEAEHEA